MAGLAIVAMAFSEKKDYKCTCTSYAGKVVATASSFIINDTKDNATKLCGEGTTGAVSDTNSYVKCGLE